MFQKMRFFLVNDTVYQSKQSKDSLKRNEEYTKKLKMFLFCLFQGGCD